MKNNTGGKEISAEARAQNNERKAARMIRMAVAVVVLLLVFQFDNSSVLVQLSKWPRRAVLLLVTLALIQMSSYIAIKVWLRYSRGNTTGNVGKI